VSTSREQAPGRAQKITKGCPIDLLETDEDNGMRTIVLGEVIRVRCLFKQPVALVEIHLDDK